MASYGQEFRNRLPYPERLISGQGDRVAYLKEVEAYHAETARLEKAFRAKMAELHAMHNMPPAIEQKVFQMAWDQSHASGYDDVAATYGDLAELATEAFCAGTKTALRV
jgi:hypothetical protein